MDDLQVQPYYERSVLVLLLSPGALGVHEPLTIFYGSLHVAVSDWGWQGASRFHRMRGKSENVNDADLGSVNGK